MLPLHNKWYQSKVSPRFCLVAIWNISRNVRIFVNAGQRRRRWLVQKSMWRNLMAKITSACGSVRYWMVYINKIRILPWRKWNQRRWMIKNGRGSIVKLVVQSAHVFIENRSIHSWGRLLQVSCGRRSRINTWRRAMRTGYTWRRDFFASS